MELRDVVVVCVKGVEDVEGGGGACVFAGTIVEDMLIFRIHFVSSNQNSTSAEMLFRGW